MSLEKISLVNSGVATECVMVKQLKIKVHDLQVPAMITFEM